MAQSDDPPFLTIGTEVSAKYRGAFCEATIKLAKKLVRCKVSYAKGQSALVSSDVVKGQLKVGATVEVKQSDGELSTATVSKLTDQSTYTVVFDDGDECTLRRSSLCLKGGRHYHESESLDNQPLTDPENFGAPVKKYGRKRRRGSPVVSRDKEGGGKKKCSYPTEFPVGKAVFLENDRRRSCWLPAVIVPPHYVMEESEVTPDTICLRSFKDGRFFVATKNELHDFSPDKEPLLGMLEGEIQTMYMCKPAIERARAYLDTGELPWDMDLFDKNTEHSSPVRHRDLSSADKEDQNVESMAAEREAFTAKYNSFMESKGQTVSQPSLGGKELDLCRLYKLVCENGGMERVSQEMKWRSIHLQLGLSPIANASHIIHKSYKKHLHGFEMFEKGKGQKVVKDGATKRAKREASDEEDKPPDKTTPKPTRKPEPKTKPETPEKTTPKQKIATPKSDKSSRPVRGKDLVTDNGDSTSEAPLPHRESPVAEASSSLGTRMERPPNCLYAESDHVLVRYGKGKSLRTYQAKIQGVEISPAGISYLVHYNGWNNRYNEWVEGERLAGKVNEDDKQSRPHFPRKTKRKSAKPPGATDSSTPSPVPSPLTEATPPATTPPNEPKPVKIKVEPKETPLKKSAQPPKPASVGGTNKKHRVKKRTRSMSESDQCDTRSPHTTTPTPMDTPNKIPRLSPPAQPPSPPTTEPCDPSVTWSERRVLEPPQPPASETDESSKRGENSWDSPRGSTSSSSGHGSLTSSGGSESGEESMLLGGLAAVVAAADALVCAEKVPELSGIKPRPLARVSSNVSEDGLSVLATQATHQTTSTQGLVTTNTALNSPRPSEEAPTCNVGSPNGYHTGDSVESKPPAQDDAPSLQKEGRGKRKGSGSPVGKRRVCESQDEFQARKLARRSELNFRIDFSALPEMSREERTVLIQQKIHELQSRWLELRSEVAYLERKKRRARRKERENARQVSHAQTPPTNTDPTLTSVQCH